MLLQTNRMKDRKFKLGDIVTAIGFPEHKMVIEMFHANDSYGCYWQDSKGKKYTADYPGGTLVLWTAPPATKKLGIVDEIFGATQNTKVPAKKAKTT